MDLQIELHLLDIRLNIISIKKAAIHEIMYPVCKLAFTDKTRCGFFSFTETNEDYSLVVDNVGFAELRPYLGERIATVSRSQWVPMYLCGEDTLGSMSISKIAKFIISPLADWSISIMTISMYQCDYILIQEKDYDIVVNCLSNHIPKICDESLAPEDEVIFQRKDLSNNHRGRALSPSKIISPSKIVNKPRSISLPLIIPDKTEYCITGLYNHESFSLIISTLMEIMFFDTGEYIDEIFFNFTKKDNDISLVLEVQLLKKFPPGTLLNIERDYWKMIRIGQMSVDLQVCGVCASISHPLEAAGIDEYYISSYHTGYCFIPSDKLSQAEGLFTKWNATIYTSSAYNLNLRMLQQQQHKNSSVQHVDVVNETIESVVADLETCMTSVPAIDETNNAVQT